MRLPKNDSGYWIKTRYGRYVAARLTQKKRPDLAKSASDATAEVRDKGRAWEDAVELLSEKIAIRDGIDGELDAHAKEWRLKLASRSVSAVRERPYTSIFHQGITYYTAAPLKENEARYRELLKRMAEALPATDEVLVAAKATIPKLVEDFALAVRAHDDAQTQAGLARTALDVAGDAWTRQMEKIYGALVHDLSRAEADAFFPRFHTRTAETPVADDPQSAG